MKVTDREYALELDKKDPLAHFKSQFVVGDPDMCYLDGNSLGRLPKATITAINDFMTKEWGPEVVTGWSHWVDEAQPTGDLLLDKFLYATQHRLIFINYVLLQFMHDLDAKQSLPMLLTFQQTDTSWMELQSSLV
jgi:kynureninase